MLENYIIYLISPLDLNMAQSFLLFVLTWITAGFIVDQGKIYQPVKISGIASTFKKGSFVSIKHLYIIIGILVAFVIDISLLSPSDTLRFIMSFLLVFCVSNILLLNIKIFGNPQWLIKSEKCSLYS